LQKPYHPKGARPIAELMLMSCGAAFEKQGFARSRVLLDWAQIVGTELSRFTAPLKMEWPRTKGDFAKGDFEQTQNTSSATLIVRVESAFALDFQYQMANVIERINGHFGWRCVGKIVIKQGPVHTKRAENKRVPPTAQSQAQAAKHVVGIEHPPLQEALMRLGAYVLSDKR
jgi:hypothetical protein